MSMSDYLENKVLDHALGRLSYTMPTTVHVSLHTASPTDANTAGTEITAGGYARRPLTIDPAAAGATANAADITFATATTGGYSNGGATAISHFGVYDAATGGNLLFWGQLGTNKTVAEGDTPVFADGSLTFSIN